MAVLNQDYEHGTSGTTMSIANSVGTGENGVDSVVIASGNTLKYDNSQIPSPVGSMAAKHTVVSTSAGNCYWTWVTAFGTQTVYWLRGFFYFPTAPSPNPSSLMSALNGTSQSFVAKLTSTGKIQLTAGTVTKATSTTVLSAGVPFRMELKVDHTNNAVTCRLFAGSNKNGTTPDEEFGYTGQTMPNASDDRVRFGPQDAIDFTLWSDDVKVSTTDWVGPSVVSGGIVPAGISAVSTVSGKVIAKHRITPAAGIQALSSISGGLGATGGGSPIAPDAGFGISEFGVGSFGETPTTGGTGGGGTGGGGTGGGGGTPITPGQPTIVPPSTPTGDAVIDFIESSPPGLFPENDESNFGFAIRGLWAAKVEDLIAQQDLIYKERFVINSEIFLDEWERETGTPMNPAGFDLTTRRAIVLGRIRKGPFTRTMRKEIVERYLKATFGGGVTFGPSGIPIGSGITLTGGSTAPDVSSVYKIVENIAGFSYTVYILNTYTPAAGMARELTRVTPAGISYTISFVATLP